MKRVAIRDTGPLLAAHEEFNTHGAMSAREGGPANTGRLPREYERQLWADTYAFGITYTVWSYATPIAWVTGQTADETGGEVIIPPVTYSLTTTRHQNLCRAWLKESI